MLKYSVCVGIWKSRKKTHFFFNPHLLASSQHGEQNVCSALAFGPVELLLYQEPELIKHVSTDFDRRYESVLKRSLNHTNFFPFQAFPKTPTDSSCVCSYPRLFFYTSIYIVPISSQGSQLSPPPSLFRAVLAPPPTNPTSSLHDWTPALLAGFLSDLTGGSGCSLLESPCCRTPISVHEASTYDS